jgi:polysaccharide biosynthesis/export protein
MLSVLALAMLPLQAAPAPRQGPETPAPTEYAIGADDILKVTVYGYEDLTQTVVVQPDGTFTFPLIGRVQASGRTPRELEKQITEALLNGFVRNPQVGVVVQEYRSKMVFVVGEVQRPGTYPLTGNTSVVEILSKAGPMTAHAGSEVVVVRPLAPTQGPVLPSDVTSAGGTPAAEVLHVNVRDIQAGDIDKNLPLKSGDTVFVPAAVLVYVSGEVKAPGGFAFMRGMTARQAISLAGGFTEDASQGRIVVVREVGGRSQEVKVKLDERLLPGDTVVVKARFF